MTWHDDRDPLAQSARRGMLERLASDLAVISRPDLYEWTCCMASFDHINSWGETESWGWMFCGGGWPGDTSAWQRQGRVCGHWHHRYPPILLA